VKTIQPSLLKTAIERLQSEFQPEQIWLFGSHAWGTPTEDSDVDLMVIVSQSAEPAIKRTQRAHLCLRGIGFPKDVLVATRGQVDRYKHLRASLFHAAHMELRKFLEDIPPNVPKKIPVFIMAFHHPGMVSPQQSIPLKDIELYCEECEGPRVFRTNGDQYIWANSD
jgi:hypothetical protein